MPYLGKSPSFGVRQRYQYTATASQTTFSGTDTANLTLNYTDNNFVDVYQNGVLLKGGGNDYTATSGTSVVLGTGATADDVIEIIVYDAFSAANFYSRTDSDSRYVRHDSGTAGTDNFIAGNNAGDAIQSGGNYNTVVGNEAGTAITTGDRNVAVGFEAGKAISTGGENVAIGYQALATEDGNGLNVAIGSEALENLNAGADANTVAVGHNAGKSLTTGTTNTLIGALAGDALTVGSENVAIGDLALSADTQGSRSVAIGRAALDAQNFTSATQAYNTAVGYDAGGAVTTGRYNTFMGAIAADSVTEGGRNTALGYGALQTDTLGSRSTAVGFNALGTQNFTSATDNYNIGIGYDAGGAVTTGQNNTIIGGLAGDALTTGGNNVAIGIEALSGDTTGSNSTAIGRNALFAQNFTGSENSENTAIGSLAGQSVTDGQQNTLIGMGAGGSITTGNANICIGREAATGSNDISGETPITTGSGNVIIGKACQAHSASASTVIVMGFECTATGNENFTFGKGSTDSNIAFGGTSISAPSDERYKENIETSTAGLSFINDLRPVTFKWKMEKDVPSDHKAYVKDSTTRVMSAKDEFYHGFIAQEVKAAIDKHSEVKNYDGLWAENIDGRQRVAPAELIPMLTKAVQELSAKNDALEARIKKLEDG